jgi:hypothetical protein
MSIAHAILGFRSLTRIVVDGPPTRADGPFTWLVGRHRFIVARIKRSRSRRGHYVLLTAALDRIG